MPHAGRNVRLLAFHRRTKAISLLGTSVALIALPFVATSFARNLLFLPSTKFTLPIHVYLACFLFAVLVLIQAQYWWKRANHADQGALAEEEIAAMLDPLKDLGWHIEYGISDRRVGDIDIFLFSPKKRAYTIDVKSHRGKVCWNGRKLYRQYGRSQIPFEKDFLKQAKRQAVVMKQNRDSKFVTPLVVFSGATVLDISNPVQGVYVIGREKLLSCLQSLG
ncbi:MAG: NERD domain-containing protein [Myxacorys californica WJT36-NPBG1]|jgi:hypothetical protein|nr:NERD domain-containing protein [Myxacorys californica WJT36-NPBG1]